MSLAFLAFLAFLLPATARGAVSHRGFVEVVGGTHTPLFGTRYRDLFGTGPVLGFRGGAFQQPDPGGHNAFALEFAFEATHPSDSVRDLPDQTYDFDEFRCLFGARWMYFVRPEMHFYLRAMGGVDVLAIGGTNTLAHKTVDASKSEAGIGAELSVGSSWRLGSINLGVELTVPWSMHEDDGTASRYHVNTSYDALSVDLMLTVSTRR